MSKQLCCVGGCLLFLSLSIHSQIFGIIYLLAYEDGTDSVPKRRNIKFRHRGITQKKTYNIQNKAKVWNQEVFYLFVVCLTTCGPGSIVGIATGYGLDGPGIAFRCGRDFPHLSRPALGPTQPPVQWVPGLSPGIKSGRGVTLTPHPFLVPLVMKE
jgi:hypothetical protein